MVVWCSSGPVKRLLAGAGSPGDCQVVAVPMMVPGRTGQADDGNGVWVEAAVRGMAAVGVGGPGFG